MTTVFERTQRKVQAAESRRRGVSRDGNPRVKPRKTAGQSNRNYVDPFTLKVWGNE